MQEQRGATPWGVGEDEGTANADAHIVMGAPRSPGGSSCPLSPMAQLSLSNRSSRRTSEQSSRVPSQPSSPSSKASQRSSPSEDAGGGPSVPHPSPVSTHATSPLSAMGPTDQLSTLDVLAMLGNPLPRYTHMSQ